MPGPGLCAMRLTVHFSGASNRRSAAASRSVSFTSRSSTYSNVSRSQGRSGYRRHSSSSSPKPYRAVIGISCSLCSGFDAFSETASLPRTDCVPCSRILGTTPAVETVMRRWGMPTPRGSARSRVARITARKLSRGSPIPIITTFSGRRRSRRPCARPSTTTCATISPAVKLRSSPISAVKQNLQSTGQPTCVEMHRVSRRSSGM